MFQVFISLNFGLWFTADENSNFSVFRAKSVIKTKVFNALMLDTKKYDHVHHSMLGRGSPAWLMAVVQLCRGPDGLRLC